MKSGKADQPVHGPREGTESGIPPVFIPQSFPSAYPVKGQTKRPYQNKGHDEPLAVGIPLMDAGMVIPDQEDGKRCQAPVRIIKAGIVKSNTEQKYKKGGGKVIYKGSHQQVTWFSGQFVKEEDGDEMQTGIPKGR